MLGAAGLNESAVPGETLRPRHPYHQTQTIKIFMCSKTEPRAALNVDQALEVIRKLHNLTRGIPTIAYLVGWQYEGHDSKYPAWFEVNRKIGGMGSKSAHKDLLKLMSEARRFNTTASVHINMDDAYENSPLWREYREADVLIREEDGSLRKGGVWGDEQSYLVCKAREWESGLARRRIDQLLELLPIAGAGTVHIDVFQPLASPYHGVTEEGDVEAMKQIIRYWHSRGVDVTKEWFHHEFAGLIPMVWHLNLDEASRLKYSPDVLCGGGSGWNSRAGRGSRGTHGRPEDGCLFEDAWGHAMYGEPEIGADAENLSNVLDHFCLTTLPWYFLNRQRAVRHVQTATRYSVEFTGEVRTDVDVRSGKLRLTAGDRLLVDGTDLCVPALWRPEECIAYSREGGLSKWQLPEDWRSVGRVDVAEIGPEGLRPSGQRPVVNGWVTLEPAPGQGLSLTPA